MADSGSYWDVIGALTGSSDAIEPYLNADAAERRPASTLMLDTAEVQSCPNETLSSTAGLRDAIAQLVTVEQLNPSAFVLSQNQEEEGPRAVVQVEVLKPILSAENPGSVTRLVDRALTERQGMHLPRVAR